MRFSEQRSANDQVVEWTEKYSDVDNAQFFTDALSALEKSGIGNRGLMCMGFVGIRDIPGVTLRQAQSVLRWDLRPSLWSHVFLFNKPLSANSKSARNLTFWEAPLHARTGLFPRPEDNGVSEGKVSLYEDPKLCGNVALVAVSMSDKEAKDVRKRAAQFNIDRTRFDLWDTLGVWQRYLWSKGADPNPLRLGFPIPAAHYAQLAFEELGLDLTPGADERNSAPEHIWNGALWWSEAAAALDRKIQGYYVLRDKGCSLLSRETVADMKI